MQEGPFLPLYLQCPWEPLGHQTFHQLEFWNSYWPQACAHTGGGAFLGSQSACLGKKSIFPSQRYSSLGKLSPSGFQSDCRLVNPLSHGLPFCGVQQGSFLPPTSLLPWISRILWGPRLPLGSGNMSSSCQGICKMSPFCLNPICLSSPYTLLDTHLTGVMGGQFLSPSAWVMWPWALFCWPDRTHCHTNQTGCCEIYGTQVPWVSFRHHSPVVPGFEGSKSFWAFFLVTMHW